MPVRLILSAAGHLLCLKLNLLAQVKLSAAGAPAEPRQQYGVHSSNMFTAVFRDWGSLSRKLKSERISELLLIPSLPTFQKVDGTQQTDA